MAFWQLCNARGKNKQHHQHQKIKLYLFYKKTKDSFLHLIKIFILFVFEQTTLPALQNQHIYVLHCFLELLGAIPPTGYLLPKAPTLTITFCFSLKLEQMWQGREGDKLK